MSDQQGDGPPLIGGTPNLGQAFQGVYNQMLDTVYGAGTAESQRAARERAATAAAEADARTAELTARHLMRSDYRERLKTIREAAITAGLVSAIVLALLMLWAVNLLIWDLVP